MKNFYLLKGLLRCAHCGRKWEATAYPSKNDIKNLVYRCANKYPKKYGEGIQKCDTPTIRADIFDDNIWSMIKNVIDKPDQLIEKLQTTDDVSNDSFRMAYNGYRTN